MSSCEGSVVSKHCAYARRSGGICALCRIPTCNQSIVSMPAPSRAAYDKATTDVLQQTEDKNRQHLQVLRDRELRTCTRTRRGHARLVRGQDLDHLVEERIARVLELVRDRPLDGFVCEERGDGDLVRGREDLGEVAGGGQRRGDDTDAAFT